MIPYARVYESEQNARDAVSKLTDTGLSADAVLFLEPSSGAEAITKAIEEERLPKGFSSIGPKAMQAGHYIVAASGGFGRSKPLVDALEAAGPVEVTVPDVSERNPSPLSSFLGLPVLSDTQRSHVTLSDHDWLPMSLFGLLTKSQKPWFGGLSKSKPMMGGLTKSQGPVLPGRLLSQPKGNWTSSFGIPLLADANRRYRRARPDFIPYARVYATEANAREALSKLTEAGVSDSAVLMISPSSGADAVKRAAEDGQLPYGFTGLASKIVEAGQYVVSVRSVFGQGAANQAILDSCGPLDVPIPELKPRSATPLSDFFGWPVLADSRSHSSLAGNGFSLTGFLGLLTKSGKPIIGGLTKDGKPMMGGLAKSKPIMGGLSKPKKNWTRSFGFPLLSNNPAPLSSLLGIKTLSDEGESRK